MQYFALVHEPGNLSTWWQVIRFDQEDIIWSRPHTDFDGDWIADQSLVEYMFGDDTAHAIEITEAQARQLLGGMEDGDGT